MNDTATSVFGRRKFLRHTGIGGAALAGATLLGACGNSSSSTPSNGQGYGELALQLSWIKNIEFAGEYFATTNGYFKDAGFSQVKLLAGGVTGAEESLLAGQAKIGLSSPTVTAPSVLKGANLKIIGSTYQKNPYCLLSLEQGAPIRTVADLPGRRIGVQAGGNLTVFEGFLKANGLTDKDVQLVTTQYDITPLEKHDYDAHFSFITNEPILAKSAGYTPVVLKLADHGLPFAVETFTVTQDTIDKERDMLKAFLVAEIKGWTDAVKDPAGSAKLAVDDFGKDQKLDLAEQTAEATAQVGLVVTDDVNANGLFTMTDAFLAQNTQSLTAMGMSIRADELFDLSLLEEVYKANPNLKTQFVIPS